MTKNELIKIVEVAKDSTRNALQTVCNALSDDQKKQLIENSEVKALFDLYGVRYEN